MIALAVGFAPAPGPEKTNWLIFSPSATKAFNAPLIAASGCFLSISTGCTLALNPFSLLSICATNLIVLPSLDAQSKSSFVISEIPSVNTSLSSGDTPKHSKDKSWLYI